LNLSFEAGADRFQLSDFEELFPAASVDVKGLKNRHRRPGFGLAFAALKKHHETTPETHYYPKKGLTFPVSAAIHFEPTEPVASGNPRQVTFALYDTNKVESITVRGRELTVAADFTAPFALLISKSKLSALLGLSRMIQTEDFDKSAGFSMVQPYDPNKIPIITVHGLLSSPLTWIDLHNDLMGDPEIRKRYQIWHFSYSTGMPILLSASLFRERLDDLYNTLDPTHQSANLNNTVVIAHSMGGLLTHTVVSDSRDALWQAFFGKPESELKLAEDDKKEFQKMLNFESQPFIKRVVFVAVPHRGSTMSESPIGWIGRKLISLPRRMVELADGLMKRTSALLKPEVREMIAADSLTGIRGLSPSNPSIQTLASIPVDEQIPFHSIIGDQGSGLGVNGSDGVVEYKSSHLDGAQSELIVPADHSAHSNPLAVLEIERILRLHLMNSGRDINATPATDTDSGQTLKAEPLAGVR
jgi:pimeloyl-ACP methyl ester carboxylesterase